MTRRRTGAASAGRERGHEELVNVAYVESDRGHLFPVAQSILYYRQWRNRARKIRLHSNNRFAADILGKAHRCPE
jgi:hypothetical protein